jgi:hypothetical protein
MNAVLLGRESRGEIHMPEAERGVQDLGELRADIRHLQSDMTDVKAELRTTNQRMDERFDAVLKEIGGIKESLASTKVWAIGLYSALAGTMLYVMARGFKWL